MNTHLIPGLARTALIAALILALGPALAADRKSARSGFGVSSPQPSADGPCGRRGCDDRDYRGRRDGQDYDRGQGAEHNWGEDYNSRGHRRGQRSGSGSQGQGGGEDTGFGSSWDEIRRNEALIVPAPKRDTTKSRSSGSIGTH
jgi:hypothetical protein